MFHTPNGYVACLPLISTSQLLIAQRRENNSDQPAYAHGVTNVKKKKANNLSRRHIKFWP